MNRSSFTRGRLVWGAAGLAIGFLLMGALVMAAAPGRMISERQSPYDVETTVRTIAGNATQHGWKVSKIYNFRDSLASPGGPAMAPIQVVEMCQLDYARELLTSGKNRFVAAMMPCAVAVYEKEDGKTYVASMNVGIMGSLFGGKIGEVMAKVGRDDELILRFLAAR
jgi:uncharacterized protein (DUF302 family)